MIKRIKSGDVVALAVAVIAVAGFSYQAYGLSAPPALVRIEAAGTTHLYSLAESRMVKPLPEDGTCELLIQDKSVRVVASDCPQKICVSMGQISSTSQWIACLPHQVFIHITGATPDSDGELGVDAATF